MCCPSSICTYSHTSRTSSSATQSQNSLYIIILPKKKKKKIATDYVISHGQKVIIFIFYVYNNILLLAFNNTILQHLWCRKKSAANFEFRKIFTLKVHTVRLSGHLTIPKNSKTMWKTSLVLAKTFKKLKHSRNKKTLFSRGPPMKIFGSIHSLTRSKLYKLVTHTPSATGPPKYSHTHT